MNYSSILRQRSFRLLPSLHHNLTSLRFMGGGPRTFPGGLNKWQWKRLHEKKAREKEKRLLEHEKQLYQARVRSQIRANIIASENPGCELGKGETDYKPLSPQEHIKALADRFMKEGAEDLWNENDGPIKTPPPMPKRKTIGEPIDLRELFVSQNSSFSDSDVNQSANSENTFNSVPRARNFSSGSAGLMASAFDLKGYSGDAMFKNTNNCLAFRGFYSDVGCLMGMRWGLICGFGNGLLMNSSNLLNFRWYSVDTTSSGGSKRFTFSRNSGNEADSAGLKNCGKARFPSFQKNRKRMDSSDDESDYDDEKEEEETSKRDVKRMASTAALGKYDVKKKRVPLKFVADEDDLSRHVEMIRKDVSKRSLEETGGAMTVEETIYSSKRFDEYDVSPLTVKALNAAGYIQMTRVQEATLSACLQGSDAFVKARTGTGKSAAFLLPAIETVLKASSSNAVQRISPIYVLVLCPTRELASQIAAEATVLLKYHDGIGVQTLVGGMRFKEDQKRLELDPCQIIVATPGRLLDHVENKSSFSVRLMGLKMLILDEADHLLDLGFRKDIEKLVDCLPRQRQSLLFSATVPKEVRRMSQLVLKREHDYIDTVGYGLETPAKVKQSFLIAPHEQHLQIVYHLLKEHISETVDYKVIVFCTTAMMTSLMFSLFREMKMNVREIHSRKPQIYRTRISDEFKESKRLILVTSDVSARGMNYPDVTLVIQVGIPSDREQYIHRLGRTGREGKEGKGIILLAPWEEYFLDELQDLPLEKCSLPYLDANENIKMEGCLRKLDVGVKEAAYHAWLGYYNSMREIGRDKTTLVELANKFSSSIGLEKPPALLRKTALKMGLKGIPGIRIQ
ncbi:hypothetical protein M9H77_32715 [Catharanthus roseus]|uniref:Uncharacterized protein n=1 Tax=Catharanthus roseus TaxID=4058 RepID=A0ACC0A3Q6_CATRO|nr:hypothetical protein M9H77_32715 [Catharanthus roseus]